MNWDWNYAWEVLPGIVGDGLLITLEVTVLASSSVYETEPVGEVLDQRPFYNACLRVETELGPEGLLDACKGVEQALGRELAGDLWENLKFRLRGSTDEGSQAIRRRILGAFEAAELEESRAYLLGREPFRRETARQWADLLIEAEEYGIPLDDFEHRKAELIALDRATVEAAARRHIHPGELRVTVGLPEEDSAAAP